MARGVEDPRVKGRWLLYLSPAGLKVYEVRESYKSLRSGLLRILNK